MAATLRKLRLDAVQSSMEQKLGLVDWLRSAQLALGWAAVLVILSVAVAVLLYQVSQTALIGRNAQLIRRELDSMRRENTVLRLRIAEMQAQTARQQSGLAVALPTAEERPAVEYLTVQTLPTPLPAEAAAADLALPDPPETFGAALAEAVRTAIGPYLTGVSRGR